MVRHSPLKVTLNNPIEMASESHDPIPSLKRKSKDIKSRLTRFSNYLKSGDLCQEEIKTKLDGIIQNFNAFQLSYEDTIDKVTDETMQQQLSETILNIEEDYYLITTSARKIVNQNNENANTNKNNEKIDNTSNIVTGVALQQNIKLPEITLPQFDGSLEDWPVFRDKFQTRIDKNSNISDVDKFQYLQSSLSGKAARTIEAIETTGENYKEAWTLLSEKYDNTRKIISRHWAILFNLPPILKDTPEAIDELVDILNQHIRALKNLGVAIEQHDSLLIHLISTKLNPLMVYNWEITLKDKTVPSYTSLLKFLEQRGNCTMGDTKDYYKLNKSNNYPRYQTNQRNKNQVFHTNTKNDTSKLECHICKEEHRIYNCPKFLSLTIKERIDAVSKNLCFNCLAKGHSAKNCRSGSCHFCNKKHHSLIHLDPQSSNKSTS